METENQRSTGMPHALRTRAIVAALKLRDLGFCERSNLTLASDADPAPDRYCIAALR